MDPETPPTRQGAVDAAALIHFFGGRSSLHAKLTNRGHDITIKGIDKWRERGSVQPGWLGVLAEVARDEGRTLDLTQFLTSRAPQASTADVLE